MKQPIENTGAGEGNRTLVISLEGECSAASDKGFSDKTPPKIAIEYQRIFGAVRTSEQPVLPNVQAARERDAAARARLRAGANSDTTEDQPDFATKIRTAESSGRRGRRR